MLFGHQNDDNNVTSTSVPAPTQNPLAIDPATGASLPVPPPQPLDTADAPEPTSVLNQAPSVIEPTPSVSAPLPPFPANLNAPEPPVPSFNEPTPTPELPAEPTPEPEATSEPSVDADSQTSGDLLALKQQALTQLQPLVGQLDQTPEEKFRTTMMLIQSSDNQSLLQSAYDAAQAIPDEKARAQALLDVVNEINYFTQQKPQS